MAKSHKFVAYFDCLGFEFIVDYTAYSQQKTMDILCDRETSSPFPNLEHARLRAQFNQHRGPEIWIFESTMSEEELKQIADDNPQLLADSIRRLGEPVYRVPTGKAVIV